LLSHRADALMQSMQIAPHETPTFQKLALGPLHVYQLQVLGAQRVQEASDNAGP
jgi:hypothetical protein